MGFVLGTKGGTLRGMETKHHTFMFFDNENEYAGCKRLFILGQTTASRLAALAELEDMVSFKLTGKGTLPRSDGALRGKGAGKGDQPRGGESAAARRPAEWSDQSGRRPTDGQFSDQPRGGDYHRSGNQPRGGDYPRGGGSGGWQEPPSDGDHRSFHGGDPRRPADDRTIAREEQRPQYSAPPPEGREHRSAQSSGGHGSSHGGGHGGSGYSGSGGHGYSGSHGYNGSHGGGGYSVGEPSGGRSGGSGQQWSSSGQEQTERYPLASPIRSRGPPPPLGPAPGQNGGGWDRAGGRERSRERF